MLPQPLVGVAEAAIPSLLINADTLALLDASVTGVDTVSTGVAELTVEVLVPAVDAVVVPVDAGVELPPPTLILGVCTCGLTNPAGLTGAP